MISLLHLSTTLAWFCLVVPVLANRLRQSTWHGATLPGINLPTSSLIQHCSLATLYHFASNCAVLMRDGSALITISSHLRQRFCSSAKVLRLTHKCSENC